MTVYCSYCSTGYLLPDHLMGPRGARVRCPKCGKTFVVLRDPPVTGPEPAPRSPEVETLGPDIVHERASTESADPAGRAGNESTTSSDPIATVTGDDDTLAREMLDALAAHLGPRLAEVRGRGRVLAEFGPDLMRVVDEYRRRAPGPGALLAFKHVLRERWGVDLITGVEG